MQVIMIIVSRKEIDISLNERVSHALDDEKHRNSWHYEKWTQ